MKSMNRWVSAILSLTLLSLMLVACGDDSVSKEETIYIEEGSKEWIPDDNQDIYLMEDSHGITQSFVLHSKTEDFAQSSSSFLGINTSSTKRESISTTYVATYGAHFTLALSAGFVSYGDEVYIRLGELVFDYNLKSNQLTRIFTEEGSLSMVYTGKAIEEGVEKIYSTVDLLESFQVNNTLYSEVIHFQYADFSDKWSEFTITEVFVAKGQGLIKYKLRNGLEFTRK